jgi:hypothetical protein
VHYPFHPRRLAGNRFVIRRSALALGLLAAIACGDSAMEPAGSTGETTPDNPGVTPLTVSASAASPWRVEDFTTYGGSTTNWKNDPHNWMVTPSDWMHTEKITLDTKNTYNGHPTLRYNWPGPSAGKPWGGCNTDPAISSSYWAPSTREVWIEFVHKFASNWNDRGPGCAFGEYKFLLMWRLSDRFDIINGHVGGGGGSGIQWWSASPQKVPFSGYTACSTAGSGENCRWAYGQGQSTFSTAIPGDHWDGQWHVYRVHLRIPATKGNTDGVYEVWVDGKKVLGRYNRTFINNATGAFLNKITSIQLGSNSNSGTYSATQTWWGHLKIWTSNPGWQ